MVENHNLATPSNYQQLQRDKMLVLPDCGCLIPCTLTTKSTTEVPDIEAWKERIRKNPGVVVKPVYTTVVGGKRTLLVCGRGPKAIVNREDCGFKSEF
jgi:hypothetical protein